MYITMFLVQQEKDFVRREFKFFMMIQRSLLLICCILVLLSATCQGSSSESSTCTTAGTCKSSEVIMSKPFAVIVEAEVKPERMEEFLKMIKNNAECTRKEPACIRFDVLRAKDDPNKFFFYELYENVEAIAHHKEQDHYKSWVAFKESGGTISSVTKKMEGEFLT